MLNLNLRKASSPAFRGEHNGKERIGQPGLFKEYPLDSISGQRQLSPYGFIAADDDISLRYGIWYSRKEKRRGSIILLSGRREFMEKYIETIIELNERGFDVYSFDWRGQGLSARLLANRHKGFIDSYDAYLKDLDMFVKNIVQPEAVLPLFILAHSMGGHIALRYLHDHPKTADKTILVSPMIDILTPPFPKWLVRFMAHIALKAGLSGAYTIGSGDYNPDTMFEGNRLTSDPHRFMDEKKTLYENPDLALGGITYGWLSATFASIDMLNGPGFAEKITTPILFISAGDDRIVSLSAQRHISRCLKNCSFTEIPGACHEILVETDAIRSIFWDAFDSFIR